MRALLVFLLLLSTAGCGQKGDLIAPEDPPVQAATALADEDDDEAETKPRRRDPS